MNLRKFQVSDSLFWGYQVILDINFMTNEKHLIEIVKEDMIQFFKSKNLLMLAEKIPHCQFHIPSLSKIKSSNDEIIYVCSHIHSCNCCKD